MTTPPAHRSLPVFAGTATFWIPGVLTAVPMVIASLAGLEGSFYLVAAIVPAASLGFTLIAVASNLYARRTGRSLEFAGRFTVYRHLSERTRTAYGLSDSRTGEWYVFFPVQILILLGSIGLVMYATLAGAPHGFSDVDL